MPLYLLLALRFLRTSGQEKYLCHGENLLF